MFLFWSNIIWDSDTEIVIKLVNATATGAVLKLPKMEHVWLFLKVILLACIARMINIFIGYNDSECSSWEYESSLTLCFT